MDKTKEVLKYAGNLAYSSEETLIFSYQSAVKLKGLEGDIVECGVAAGAQVIAMALGDRDKKIHAFDSFDGIPLPSNKDDQMPGLRMLSLDEINKLPKPGEQELKSSGATVVNLDSFLENISFLENKDNIIIHKGWFENTIPVNNIEKISILRLDGDLYNSTLVCLKWLFSKVVYGGLIIIDDWELPGCRMACEEFFNSINYKPNYKFISNITYFYK